MLGVRTPVPSATHDENHAGRHDREGYSHVDRGKIWVRNFYSRNDRLSRSQRYTAVGVHRFVKHDFDRNALHNLDVVAGRILRWKQAEARAVSCLDTIDMRSKLLSVQRIHRNLNLLAGPHPGYLVLLKVRGYPHILRDQRKKTLTCLNVSPGLNRFLGHPTRLRHSDLSIGLVQ